MGLPRGGQRGVGEAGEAVGEEEEAGGVEVEDEEAGEVAERSRARNASRFTRSCLARSREVYSVLE